MPYEVPSSLIPDSANDWAPEALEFARTKMVMDHPYAVTSSVAVGSVGYQVTGDFRGIHRLKSSEGDYFIHLESSTMHHFIDVDFVREIRPVRRIEVY